MWENIFTGQLLAILGAVIAFLVSGLGSSRGVALAGQTGAGVLGYLWICHSIFNHWQHQ